MELSSVWGWPIGSRAAIIESVGSLCIWRLAKPSRRDYDGKSGELSDRASGAPNVPLFQPVSRDRPCPAFGFSNLVAILMTSTKWNRRSYPIELSCYRNGFCPKASIKVKGSVERDELHGMVLQSNGLCRVLLLFCRASGEGGVFDVAITAATAWSL